MNSVRCTNSEKFIELLNGNNFWSAQDMILNEENMPFDINYVNQNGEYPLMISIIQNNRYIFELLMKHKNIKLDQCDSNNETPLTLGKLYKKY